MQEMMSNAGALCGVLVAGSLIARLCPENKMLGFTQALVALVLLASMAAALVRVDWDWQLPESGAAENQELDAYILERYQQAAGEESQRYIEGLLAAAGLEAKKITVRTDISEDGSIVLTKASLAFRFDSDAQRALVLLRNVLPGTEIEVTTDGA